MILIDDTLYYIRLFIGGMGVVVICLGALRSLYQLFMLVAHDKYDTNYIRLQFGDSVILGLEFMVGADIVFSLVSPNYYNLGLLAIIVVIRTVLSFFLSRELQALSPLDRKQFK